MLVGMAVAAVAAAGGATAGTAQGSSATVLGAGSTWDAIATAQWAADVHNLYGITINYQAVGSTAGRQFYIENQVDFGDSDIPFLPSELAQLNGEHKTFQYLPTVAGGTALMYNILTPSGKRITNLQLDSKAIVGIFTGTITSWRDPLILSENPSIKNLIPNTKIIPVVRSDGSGTSAMFSDYLNQLQHPAWLTFCHNYDIQPCGQTSFWPLTIPGSVAQKGSDGVANYVAQQSNTITYVETGYALERRFPVVLVKNASGHFVFPSSQNDATALTHARIQSDLISDLSGVHTAPEANAYPIAGYSYMITPTKLQNGFTTAKGAVLGRFILYNACAGQRKAAQLGYSPLTPVLVQGVFAAVRRIPGAPAPPPISQCANPTLHGGGFGGGAQGNPGGSGTTGGTSPTGSTGNTGNSASTGNNGGTGNTGNGGNSGTTGKTGTGKTAKTAKTTGAANPNGQTNGIQVAYGLTMSDNQLAGRETQVLNHLAAVEPASSVPLLWIAIDVLVFALVPWLFWHQRRARSTLREYDSQRPTAGGD